MKLRKLTAFLLGAIMLCCSLPAFSAAEEAFAAFEGKVYPQSAQYIDLQETLVRDYDAFTEFLDKMPDLKRVDMWETHIPADKCHMLAEKYPQIRWGWTMVLKGSDHEHLIRTDYTSWSTLHNNTTSHHTEEDFSILKYCWNLLALDVGHNSVKNLDFLYDLPNLRVLIVACNEIEDVTPVGSLKNLEYAELFKNRITDISCLAGLEHLLDLNICFNYVKDYEPLKGLKTLTRLWMFSSQGYNKAVPEQTATEIKNALPDTLVDSTHYSTAGQWRQVSNGRNHPHYQAIIDMFGSDHNHPHFEYVPFAESAPLAPAAEEALPLATPAPQEAYREAANQGGTGLPREYLLPFDFSAGSEPKKENYTETSYGDSTIQVEITEASYDVCRYWIADIRLTDVSQLRTMAASQNGSFERAGQMTVQTFLGRSKPVLALNGDFYDSSERIGLGYIVRQGTLFRNNLDTSALGTGRLMDVLLIDENGDFDVVYQANRESIDEEIGRRKMQIINSFSFGPALVDGGKPVEDYRGADAWIDMRPDEYRARMCICQAGPLHYKVICTSGNYKGCRGLTLKEFAEIVAGQDVQVAYNLDGGDSTWLYFNGQRVNEFGATSMRKLQDIIYFASAE